MFVFSEPVLSWDVEVFSVLCEHAGIFCVVTLSSREAWTGKR